MKRPPATSPRRPRWLYALALLPVLTDLLERGGLPVGARGWITEVALGGLILALVHRLRVQFEAMAALSRADPLTGLGNRRAFDETLDAECRRAERSQQPLALLYMDLDQFKQVNDRHGHETGDRVLRQFAEAINAAVRQGLDRGWRLGGDEFALLLPGSTALQAEQVLGRIGAHCDAGDRLWRDGPLGISAGIVELAPGESAAAFVQRADEAMYESKARRRGAGASSAPARRRGAD